jgi:hypothetical protein
MTDATNTSPFGDLSKLRLDQSYADSAGVRKVLMTVPVRRPGRQDFVRVHPEPAYRLSPAAIIGEFSVATLFTTINRQGVLHLWPVKLPGPDGKHNEWHRSAAEAAERAMSRWVRVTANMSLGAYEIFEAIGGIPAPEWPEVSFPEVLKVAFRDRVVDSPDHPLIGRLRGAA